MAASSTRCFREKSQVAKQYRLGVATGRVIT